MSPLLITKNNNMRVFRAAMSTYREKSIVKETQRSVSTPTEAGNCSQYNAAVSKKHHLTNHYQ